MASGKPGFRSTVASGMIPIRRLNHAVLYVRDADRAAAFYQEAFGFEVVQRIPGVAAFLKAAGTTNHHDLGLFSVGANAPGPERGRVGLYHLNVSAYAAEKEDHAFGDSSGCSYG